MAVAVLAGAVSVGAGSVAGPAVATVTRKSPVNQEAPAPRQGNVNEPAVSTGPASRPLIEITGLTRRYELGGEVVSALRGVDLTVWQGESVAVVGPSGSGKSTLLHLLGLLDRPTEGTYRLGGTDTRRLSDDQLARLRSRAIGFVFQSFNLVAAESALDNVAAPLVYAGTRRAERLSRAREALDQVGLADRHRHRPNQLSGGQRQRVAIARALVTRPPLLLADEPTGNLDSASGADVLTLLDTLRSSGLTVITITHDPGIAAHADRVVRIADGRIVSGWSEPVGTDAPDRPGGPR